MQPAAFAVFGPTGSGKTELAVTLARALGTEVVNADPQQCYAGLPTLTNQPTAEHDAIAPHRLIGCWGMSTIATAALFAELAHAAVDELVSANGCAVVSSGSGMYLRSALSTFSFGGEDPADGLEADLELRTELERAYDERGGEVLHAELMALDPAVADAIHANDRKRLVRALEVARRGGSVAAGAGSVWDTPYRHTTTVVGIAADRASLHARINARTRAMFDGGVLDEVAAIVGPHAERAGELSPTAARIHGLSDCIDVLAGDISREQAIDQLATRTRQYAKRQDTWARRWPGLWSVPVDVAAPDAAAEVDRVATLVIHDAHVHAHARGEARP